MNQHPVPQNITSYQFRLVGEMTLKQFLELGAGVALAYFFFMIKVPLVIKIPLAVFFALMGFALAFMPIEERPLDKWIVNFIKSIYAPTRFLWQKRNLAPAYLQPGIPRSTTFTKNPVISFAKNKTVLQQYLNTLSRSEPHGPLDVAESQKLALINQLLGGGIPKPVVKPLVPVVPTVPYSPPFAAPQPRPVVKPARPLAPPLSVETLFPYNQRVKQSVAAVFSTHSSMPAAPEAPNLIVGAVLTTTDKMLPSALIEVQDKQGNIIRALKTNKLGQFFTASSLENGNYLIKVEHDDYEFATINLKAQGKIIPPLKIKAVRALSHASF